MTIFNAIKACPRLYSLIDEAFQTHKQIVISGRRNNAIVIAEKEKGSDRLNLPTYLFRFSLFSIYS